MPRSGKATASPARRRPRQKRETAPSPSLPKPPATCGNALRQPNTDLPRAMGTTYLQGLKVRGTHVALAPILCRAAEPQPSHPRAGGHARSERPPRPLPCLKRPRPAETPCASRTPKHTTAALASGRRIPACSQAYSAAGASGSSFAKKLKCSQPATIEPSVGAIRKMSHCMLVKR